MKQPTLTSTQKESLSAFQIKVYETCMQIPKGQVATYKGVAAAIMCGSSQAIGQALKKNPYNGATPSVPCHRVVKSDLSVGGFSGSYDDTDKKKAILETEGIVFHRDKKGMLHVDEHQIFNFKS